MMNNKVSIAKHIIILVFIFSIQGVLSSHPSKKGVTREGVMKNVTSVVEKWISFDKFLRTMTSKAVKMILPYAIRSSSNLNLTTPCMSGLLEFLMGISKTKLWAFQMLDSFGKINSGLLRGSVSALGDYDLCINTEVPGSFFGQYCTVDFSPPLPKRTPFVPYDVPIKEFANIAAPESVSAEILKNLRGFYWLKMRIGICVPSTCSRSEVQEMTFIVSKATGLDLEVSLPNCETKRDKVIFGASEIAIICVLSFLLSTVVLATILDAFLRIKTDKKNFSEYSISTRCLFCFSLYTNAERLLKKDDSLESIKVFHGMRVITVIWVMLTHVYLFPNYQVTSNSRNARVVTAQRDFAPVTHGHIIVQTFFYMSAVLVTYGVMKMKRNNINVFLFVIRRIWRLTPPFMFIIACLYLVPYLGSGPAWKEIVVDGLTEKCRTNWWTNLLYFNNFLDYRDMCMSWTWYISVDFQLYIVSIIILIPLKRKPRLGLLLNAGFLISATLMTAAFHIYYRVPPVFVPVFDHPADINYIMQRIYLRPHVHFPSYSVGIFVGYFLATRKKTLKIPLRLNILGWFTFFTLFLITLYGAYDWIQGDLPRVPTSTIFACTEKLVWTLTVAWITIVCMTGNGGIVNSILSWNGFVPLGRITYMAFIIHPVIYYMYIGSTRELIRFEHRTLVFIFLALVLLSFMCSVLMSLLFESPFMALEKLVLTPKKPSNKDKIRENVNAPFNY